jgi:hypothetical protein
MSQSHGGGRAHLNWGLLVGFCLEFWVFVTSTVAENL